ncbi:hypothetical protein IU500_13355 [Nocardia terpenica]|uniref:hypothetical protein n=1 Tax=Nocardia terpenica TaxID=455432 RepID=UPI001895BB40|nr:hypothetical protein [Nocardia terpenica]MBF6062836.1 hypothetical protein [Nocardia terpenica]MBF6105029.1 hypothetical protein [Nocardia terpenica]MBF6112534.1 hypothetical protein [Nocardia terpenica]MBF6118757.1 hypothetical protein [Nocardia terpenica]MBF6154226.1 hypothetical protein [Nocardia terpenica]
MNRSRRQRGPSALSMAAEDARRVFIEEYRFLRASLMTHDAIARRLGISLIALQARILRYDCLILLPAEQKIANRLDEFITAGRSFTLEQISALDTGTAALLIDIARRRGRVRPTRTRRTEGPTVFVPVTGGR